MLSPWLPFFLWPIVVAILYRNYALPVSLSATIIGGHLLLPENTVFDLPVLPPLDKDTVPAFTALIATLIVARNRHQAWQTQSGLLPRHPLPLLLLLMLVLGTFGTILTNSDPIRYGPVRLPGLRMYDAFSMVLASLTMLTPFFLGRKILATPEGHALLLKTLVIAAFAYSFLALFEVRMSPQLNNILYGFYPHSFAHAVRGDGFKPFVFLKHGLILAIFLCMAVLAALGLFKTIPDKSRKMWLWIGLWLFGTLFLSNNLGAFVIVLLIAGVILLLKPRLQLLLAGIIAATTLSYPLLRAADVIPMDGIVSIAESISPSRAASLFFRLENEDILLEHARERSTLGWGVFDRNAVYNENGVRLSVTDGFWIILLGVGGWIRYLAVFGLLCASIVLLSFKKRDAINPVTVILSLCMAASLIDALPNAGITPITWLIAGALAGSLERGAERNGLPKEASPPLQRRDKRYSRSTELKNRGQLQPQGLRTRQTELSSNR